MNEKSNPDPTVYRTNSSNDVESALPNSTSHETGNAFMFFERSDLIKVVFYGLIIGVSAVAQPLQAIVFGKIFSLLATFSARDGMSFGHFISQIRLQCGYIMIIGLVKLIFTWLGILCWMQFGETQQKRARLALSRKLFSRKIEWYDTTKNVIGRASQVNRCVEELRAGTSETLALIIQQAVSIVALIITAMIYSWLVLLVIMASAPIMVGLGWLFGSWTFKAAEEENEISSQASKVLDWILGSPAVVRLFNAKLHEAVKFYKLIDKSASAYYKLSRAVASNGAMLKFFGFMIFVQGFWFGNAMIMQHKLKINQLFTCFSSCLGLVALISQLSHWLAALNKAHAAAKSISAFLTSDDEPVRTNADIRSSVAIGDIRFENVSFKYASRPETVLKNVSFSIKSQAFTSIIGQSGLGKSTIASLLLRFYTDFNGHISIGEYKIVDINREWLADNVTYLQQSTSIFNDTFRNNVAIAVASKFDSLDDVPDLLIDEACSFAGLDPIIQGLANGKSTIISPGSLSGGQKQRVAIARAKLRDTSILIMDEALSALDETSKSHIFAEIKEWRKGKTTVNITHEFKHLSADDKVIQLEKGQVIYLGFPVGMGIDSGGLLTSSPATLVGSANFEPSEVDYIKNPAILKNLENKADEKPQPEQLMGLVAIIRACFKACDCRLLLVVGLVASLLDGVASPVFNFCFSKLLSSMVDAALGMPAKKASNMWLCVIIGISVASAILHYLSLYILAYVSEQWIVSIRKQAFTNINEQDMSFFDDENVKPAELTALIMNDTRDLRNLVADFLSVLINLVTLLSVGMIWLIVLGWKLALVGIAFVPLILLLTGGYARILQGSENKYKSAVAILENQCYDTLNNIKTIIGFNAMSHFNRQFSTSLGSICRVGLFRAIYTGFGVGLSELCNSIATGTVVYYGMRLVGTSDFSRNQMILVMTLFTFTIVSAGMLLTRMPDIARGQRAASRVLRLVDMAPLLVEKAGPRKPMGQLQGKPIIVFANVRFLYGLVPVLTGATFNIYEGEIVAIIGESGSGKSTIASLMTRLYGTSPSSIYVGKDDICNWDVEQLREIIGVVPQTAQFFQGTIYENLTYGIVSSSRITHERVLDALRQVNMHDFVCSLSEGLQTCLGEGHSSLISGGQLQRLSIARAILRKPKVLLFDECTSNLDPENTKTICNLIVDKLSKDYTIVMITHDAIVTKIATKTLLVSNGQVIETY